MISFLRHFGKYKAISINNRSMVPGVWGGGGWRAQETIQEAKYTVSSKDDWGVRPNVTSKK